MLQIRISVRQEHIGGLPGPVDRVVRNRDVAGRHDHRSFIVDVVKERVAPCAAEHDQPVNRILQSIHAHGDNGIYEEIRYQLPRPFPKLTLRVVVLSDIQPHRWGH